MKELLIRNYQNPAIVDDEDFQRLRHYTWFVNNTESSVMTYYGTKGSSRSFCVPLASVILNKPKSTVDHIDRNFLNNQKSNLRECSHQQNCFNSTKRPGTTSKYKGVSWFRRTKKWRVKIQVNGKEFSLGYFISEDKAASVYNKAAISLFKEFANLNRNEKGEIL